MKIRDHGRWHHTWLFSHHCFRVGGSSGEVLLQVVRAVTRREVFQFAEYFIAESFMERPSLKAGGLDSCVAEPVLSRECFGLAHQLAANTLTSGRL